MNRRGPDRGNDVIMDEPGAVRMFLDYAAGLGHRRFALLDGPAEVDTVYRRVGAARRVCAARGSPWPSGTPRRPRTAAGTPPRGCCAAGRAPPLCGVGSLNQLFGVMAALRDAGVECPARCPW